MWSTARAVLSWCSTTFGGASSPEEISNNLNNINDLKFYHLIRGNLNFSASPRKAMPVGAFSPEVKTDTVNPAGTTMSSPWPGLNETNSPGQSGLTTVAADVAAGNTRN